MRWDGLILRIVVDVTIFVEFLKANSQSYNP